MKRQSLKGLSKETACIIESCPYGFRRTKKRVWIESTPRGERVVSQTLNPDTNEWNKEKKGTYAHRSRQSRFKGF
jgi:hypothetical protein